MPSPPALRHANYRRYLFGAFVSNVGNMLQSAAIALHVYKLTGNSYMVGLIGLVKVGPLLIFSLVGGIVADHYDRRKVVIFTQCAMSAVALMLTAMEWVHFKNAVLLDRRVLGHEIYLHITDVGLIYLLVALLSVTTSFDNPARQAMVPNLVPKEDLPNAIGLNGISWRLSDVLGPVVAAGVFTWGGLQGLGGVGTCYLLNFVTFIAVIVAVLMLPALPPQGQDMSRPQNLREIVQAIRDGLRFVNRTPVLRSSLWIDFWATFFSGADALIPAYAKILKVGDVGYGLMRASSGVGALIAATLLTWLPTIKHQGRWVIIMIGLYGLSTVLFGFSTNLLMAMIFLAGTGFTDMFSTVMRQTIRQLTTPDHMRGRMTATSVLFHATGPQLGDYEAGALAAFAAERPALRGWPGERWSVTIGGAASILLSLWWGKGGALRDYEHGDAMREEREELGTYPRPGPGAATP